MTEPQVEYQLEKAVTGKVEKREPVVLEDTEGNTLRAPWAPKSNCNKCYGRGFVGKISGTDQLIPCRKCYSKAR